LPPIPERAPGRSSLLSIAVFVAIQIILRARLTV
jgi:hypothetical protein